MARYLRFVAFILSLVFSFPALSAQVQAPKSGHRAIPLMTQRLSYQARIDLALEPSNMRLDVFTFTLKEDPVGYALLAAAMDVVQRGGTARIGYDAFSSTVSPELVLYMRSKGVELRAFRPLTSLFKKVVKYGPYGTLRYLNIRMHEKTFLTDGGVVVGSSNYSKDYYLIAKRGRAYEERKGEWNFRDREMYLRGPVEKEIAASFEAKWKQKEFWDLREFDDVKLTEVQKKSFSDSLATALADIKKLRGSKEWSKGYEIGPVRYVADTFGPVQKDRKVHREILKMVNNAKTRILIENPYVLLPDDMRAALLKAKKRGVTVAIYTNSIGETDEGDVNDVFKRELRVLRENGFDVYLDQTPFVFHGKVVVVDSQSVYWGSYNFDNRSKVMNSENGVFFDSSEIGKLIESTKAGRSFVSVDVESTGPNTYIHTQRAMVCQDLFMKPPAPITIKVPNNPVLRIKERFL